MFLANVRRKHKFTIGFEWVGVLSIYHILKAASPRTALSRNERRRYSGAFTLKIVKSMMAEFLPPKNTQTPPAANIASYGILFVSYEIDIGNSHHLLATSR